MGLRFRKSIKIAPGIKLNISNKSTGISVGGKGARISVNSKGRVTKSVGLPGTGISYVETSKIGSSKKKKAATGEVHIPTFEKANVSNASPKVSMIRILGIIALLALFVLFFRFPEYMVYAFSAVALLGWIPSLVYLIFFKKKMLGKKYERLLNALSIILIVLFILFMLLIFA